MIYDNASYNLVGSKDQDLARNSPERRMLQGILPSTDPTEPGHHRERG
jgi:hypothetical protein